MIVGKAVSSYLSVPVRLIGIADTAPVVGELALQPVTGNTHEETRISKLGSQPN